jgi:protein ImuB
MLRALDVRTVGQLQKRPRSSLPSRFGPKVLQRLNQALGDHPEQIVPERLAEPIEAEWVFEHPLADRRTIGSVLQQLIERVTIQLTAQNVAARRLDCRLRCENNRALDFSVSLVKPSAVAAHLRELMLLKLDRLTIDGLVTGIHLEVAKTGPLEIRERELFESGVNREHAREQAALLERLSSRLGERAVLRPHLSPDAQPEYGFRYEPVMRESTSRPEKTLQPDAQRTAPIRYGVSVRPLHLYPRPMPVEVMSVVPEGPPIRFHWKNREHVIVRSWGPERIETGWWRGRHIERDYYRVETEAGRRFWLFRGANDDEWFLHGAFE